MMPPACSRCLTPRAVPPILNTTLTSGATSRPPDTHLPTLQEVVPKNTATAGGAPVAAQTPLLQTTPTASGHPEVAKAAAAAVLGM